MCPMDIEARAGIETQSPLEDKDEIAEIINTASNYALMKKTAGWKKIEQEIQDRNLVLTKRLITEGDSQKISRLQGEILGINSILNIVSVAIENAKIAEEEKEINNGEEKED